MLESPFLFVKKTYKNIVVSKIVVETNFEAKPIFEAMPKFRVRPNLMPKLRPGKF